MTGAHRAGFNLRGMADCALARLPLSVRGEVSVTRLSSRPRPAARYHQVLSSPRGSPFIPVTVGVLF